MKIKKGDNVIVIAGKSKGETGKVAKVFPVTSRIIVEGVNKVTRRIKPKKRNEKGSVVEREAAFHVSNVMILDPETNKRSRVGKKLSGENFVRVSKKSGKELK